MQNSSSTFSLFLRRSAAFLYDCLLLIALYFIITAIALAFNHGQAIQHHLFKLLLLAVAFLFFDWFWRHGGQTLGMRAWRIQLESSESSSVTRKQTAIRFITGTLLFGFTLLTMFVSPDKQALHDKLSRTTITNYNK